VTEDDSKEENEGDKQVAVYMVHGLESQCRTAATDIVFLFPPMWLAPHTKGCYNYMYRHWSSGATPY